MIESTKNSSIDPELEAMFAKLRDTPERDSQVAAEGRAKFEAQLDSYLSTRTTRSEHVDGFWMSLPYLLKEKYQNMKTNYRFAFMSLAVLLVLAAVLFGGAGATVTAAKAALPGDALYPVKTGWEQTRARLSSDSYNQAQLYLQFAELRLNEADALIAEGRYDDIMTAVSEFEFYIEKSMASLGNLILDDPARAAELSTQLSEALSRFAIVLTDMMNQVPADVASEMQNAIKISESAIMDDHDDEIEIIGTVDEILDGAIVVDGVTIKFSDTTEIKGDLSVGAKVKVHAVVEDDGSLTAREIEPSLDDGDIDNANDNGNINANDNSDDNANSNVNESVNDNDDDDVNDNDDDDVNDNDDDDVNDNDDDDSNDNDDDDSNDNDDDDSNDNDDDDSNDNDDDDSNDNDDDDSDDSNDDDSDDSNDNGDDD